MGELVLITGTSSGIGLSAAIDCAARGHRVVATMRDLTRRGDLEKTAAARNLSLGIEQLDVTSDNLGAKVRELVMKYGPIYGLVNNAGIAVAGVFEEQGLDDVRDQFETNVFGLMGVTRAVLPVMRAARRGRIINVSSLAGRVALPALSVYAATKHAIEGFSESLRWELDPFGIEVCVVEPGTFKTPMFFANQRRGTNVDMGGAYSELNQQVEKVYLEEADKAAPPDAVGRAIARMMGQASPAFRTVVGKDARALVALRGVVPDRLFVRGFRRLMGLPRPR